MTEVEKVHSNRNDQNQVSFYLSAMYLFEETESFSFDAGGADVIYQSCWYIGIRI